MKVCIVPNISKLSGGPASFQRKLSLGLEKRGIRIVYDLDDEPYDAILVINCIRQTTKLIRAKRRGIRIVQRLGVPNWIHRHLSVGLKGYLLREYWNLNMRLIRSFIADHIVYQTEYAREIWNRKFGVVNANSTVIYNGVDLFQFCPEGEKYQSQADVCIISVEGTQGNDPFNIAVNLGQRLADKGLSFELLMLGQPWRDAQSRFAQYPFINFKGYVDNSELPRFYRGATLSISTDIITAACPNSVIESLACGTPVLGYKIGPLPELVLEAAGCCVEYEDDPLKGGSPGNLEGLANAALRIIECRSQFAHAARRIAEERYGVKQMCDAYVEVLSGNKQK